MNTYTKRQRHAIYKQALKAFDASECRGLCTAFFYVGVSYPSRDLPEFASDEPKVLKGQWAYWWPLNGRYRAACRRRLLKYIDMTKPTKRTK